MDHNPSAPFHIRAPPNSPCTPQHEILVSTSLKYNTLQTCNLDLFPSHLMALPLLYIAKTQHSFPHLRSEALDLIGTNF